MKHGDIIKKPNGETMFVIDTKESGLVGIQLIGLSPNAEDYEVINNADIVRFRLTIKEKISDPPSVDIDFSDVWYEGVSEHGTTQLRYKDWEHLREVK